LQKFQLCKDENCAIHGDIGPTDVFRIKDFYSQAALPEGQQSNEWLSNAKSGQSITKTPLYEKTGNFTITKLTGGNHCLGGVDAGLTLTNPENMVAASFTATDIGSCVNITVAEVACDPRSKDDNSDTTTSTSAAGAIPSSATPSSATTPG
jgi:hypothetical protein